jgi:hypothetical protein
MVHQRQKGSQLCRPHKLVHCSLVFSKTMIKRLIKTRTYEAFNRSITFGLCVLIKLLCLNFEPLKAFAVLYKINEFVKSSRPVYILFNWF